MAVTTLDIRNMKGKQKIAMVTAYDALIAKIVDSVGIPLILVGDSVGNTYLGLSNTVPVTIADMIHHTKAVTRATKHALVVADLPFMTYATEEAALHNAGRLLQEGGCQAVKLEGGQEVAGIVRRLVGVGIPVMGHIGLLPQSVNQQGGYRIQGKTAEQAQKLLEDAKAIEASGAFSIVLEGIPHDLAAKITAAVSIPTIGIAAGPDCDGQVQVITDLLGMQEDFVPKHARQYANLAAVIRSSLQQYKEEVEEGTFGR
ncbi:MAG TPA: 3-methyl-2-oxobutanoate hydroxymethyltransferase [Firmicutes bacterium]|nr:3-methyl-2-oxobutanoate hydroxymethyltransferase [Bacillota bacterium]